MTILVGIVAWVVCFLVFSLLDRTLTPLAANAIKLVVVLAVAYFALKERKPAADVEE